MRLPCGILPTFQAKPRAFLVKRFNMKCVVMIKNCVLFRPTCCKSSGLCFLKLRTFLRTFCVTFALYIGINVGINIGENERKVLSILSHSPQTTAKELSEVLGVTLRQCERILASMKQKGLIVRVGSNKNGHWDMVPSIILSLYISW